MPGAWRRGWAGGRVTQIAVDPAESAAARSAGTLLTGGGNDKGQLDLGYTKPGATAPRRKHTCPPGQAGLRQGESIQARLERTGRRVYRGLAAASVTAAVITAPAIPATAATAASRQVAAGQQAAMPMAESPPAVFAWGQDADGQLGDGTTAESDVPVKIPGLTGVTQVAADAESSYALRSDGTVWSWGDNRDGELGTGTKDTNTDVPGQIPGLTGITQIAAGHDLLRDPGPVSVFALRSDGTLAGWGYNQFGQLGNGSTADSGVPVTVPGLTGVTQVSTSGTQTLAIAGSSHQVLAWGDNTAGELGNGTSQSSSTPEPIPLTGVTQVSAGQQASAAVRSDGTLLTWGDNQFGQLGRTGPFQQPSPLMVPGLTNVSQVLMASLFSVAVGQPASTVPDLTGLPRGAATQALSTAGLALGAVHTLVDPTCTSIGKVVDQDPSPAPSSSPAPRSSSGSAPALPLPARLTARTSGG